jgi:hypothetical protein
VKQWEVDSTEIQNHTPRSHSTADHRTSPLPLSRQVRLRVALPWPSRFWIRAAPAAAPPDPRCSAPTYSISRLLLLHKRVHMGLGSGLRSQSPQHRGEAGSRGTGEVGPAAPRNLARHHVACLSSWCGSMRSQQ